MATDCSLKMTGRREEEGTEEECEEEEEERVYREANEERNVRFCTTRIPADEFRQCGRREGMRCTRELLAAVERDPRLGERTLHFRRTREYARAKERHDARRCSLLTQWAVVVAAVVAAAWCGASFLWAGACLGKTGPAAARAGCAEAVRREVLAAPPEGRYRRALPLLREACEHDRRAAVDAIVSALDEPARDAALQWFFVAPRGVSSPAESCVLRDSVDVVAYWLARLEDLPEPSRTALVAAPLGVSSVGGLCTELLYKSRTQEMIALLKSHGARTKLRHDAGTPS